MPSGKELVFGKSPSLTMTLSPSKWPLSLSFASVRSPVPWPLVIFNEPGTYSVPAGIASSNIALDATSPPLFLMVTSYVNSSPADTSPSGETVFSAVTQGTVPRKISSNRLPQR